MDEKKLIDLIKADKKKKKDKYVARKYYSYKPRNKENQTLDVNDDQGNIKTIVLEKSTEIYINYFKFIVNQKRNYLLSKMPTVAKNTIFTPVQLVDLLEDLILNASLDVTAWLHFYVDEDENKLNWILVEDKEIIPFYDKYNKKIIGVIRYFEDEKNKEVICVEEWHKTGVIRSKIKKDKIVEEQIRESHYEQEITYDGEVEKILEVNFPFIPFVPLNNNKEKVSDLEPVYDLVVFYNSISSGFIDNIYKFQEAITKLKGFSGDKETLRETMKNLKIYKAAGIPEDGDIETMIVEIPVEARTVILELLKKALFSISGAYDPDQIGDGNITNVVINNRYYGLDSKADGLEKQLKMFYEKFIECIEKYTSLSLENEIEFNRNKLINEKDLIDSCLKSMGVISAKTIRSKHPWVTDEKYEEKQLKLEKEEAIKDMQNNHKLDV